MGIVVLANTDAQFFLSAENALFVGADATLYSSTNFASPTVLSAADGRTVQVEGTILSQRANAVVLDGPAPQSDDPPGTLKPGEHTLIVGEDGALYGNRSYVTAVVNGTGNLVQNAGEIRGGGGVWGFDWGSGRLENEGTIAGQRFAAVKLQNGVGANTILNDGTISGAGGIVLETATATILNGADGTVRSNTGAVAAVDAALANAGFTLRNNGRIAGPDDAVLGSRFNDRVVNSGAIEGDVLLGNGNDLFRGHAGIVDGELRGGGGNDTLLAGRGDDSVFGEAGNDRLDGGTGDDTLNGGAGNDVFVFGRKSDGDDLIADFADNADDLDLSGFRFAGFSAVAGRATDTTAGLLLDLRNVDGGTVLIPGMTKALLTATDVIL